MTDIVTPAVRSRIMSRIRGRDTQPEVTLRRGLHACGFRYRLHERRLPGRPDLVFAKWRAVVFVHGCFWHRHRGCPKTTRPKSRVSFWRSKFSENTARDRRQIRALRAVDWRVLVVWECALSDPKSRARTIAQAARWIPTSRKYAEIPPARPRAQSESRGKRHRH